MTETKRQLTRVQKRALKKIADHGGWLVLRDIGERWATVNALVKLGLVERHMVGISGEYKALEENS